MWVSIKAIDIGKGTLQKKNVQNLGTCPKLSAPPPPPHTTLGTQKFRNILLFEDPPPLMNLGTLILVSLVVLTLRPPN